jgi:hypothetical protein
MALDDKPPDLTPRIIRQWDHHLMQPGLNTRPVTSIQFMIGPHGPFEDTFDRAPDRFTIEQAIAKRRDTLAGLV